MNLTGTRPFYILGITFVLTIQVHAQSPLGYRGENTQGVHSITNQISDLDPAFLLTPHNTGSNGLSSPYIHKVIRDSRGRLFAISYRNLDILTESGWINWRSGRGERFKDSPQNIIEDDRGHIWISTRYRLYEYDEELNRVDSIMGKHHVLTKGPEGNLWMSNWSRGVLVLSPDSNKVVMKLDSGFVKGEVQAIHHSSDNKAWIAVTHHDTSKANGIYVFDKENGSYEIMTPENSTLPYEKISVITEDQEGNIVVGFKHSRDAAVPLGIAIYNNGEWKFTSPKYKKKSPVFSLHVDDSNYIYVASTDTLYLYKNNTWTPYLGGLRDSPLVYIYSMFEADNGDMIFLSHSYPSLGIIFHNQSGWKHISSTNDGGLASWSNYDFTTDQNGNLWIASNYGVMKYDGINWKNFDVTDGLPDNRVRSIQSVSDSTIWIGTHDHISYLKNSKFGTVERFEGEKFYTSIFEDSRRRIWFGSRGNGVLLYDKERFEKFRHYTTNSGNTKYLGHVMSFAEGPYGYIYGVRDYKLLRFDGSYWYEYTTDDTTDCSGVDGNVTSDNQGNLWFENNYGILKCDGLSWECIQFDEKVNIGSSDIEVAPDGSVWILFSDQLYIYQQGEWTIYNLAGTGTSIYHGKNGITWIGTRYEGLYKIERSNILSAEKLRKHPKEVELTGNYPNPFNPKTTIKYYLPLSSKVTINIYDMLGRQISKLLDQKQRRGYHSVMFDGSGLSSGVYFYRINTENSNQTRKMLLLK